MESYVGTNKFLNLKNGRRLKIGFLQEQMRDKLIEFFQQAPKEDVQFCKEDVKDPKVVDCWLHPENCHRIFTLVAEDLESKQIVANINLFRGKQIARLVGEIQQMLVARSFQGLGVGSQMLDEVINLAVEKNLKWLKAELLIDMKSVIKAFTSRGFEMKATLEDYATDNQEVAYDVALMLRNLSKGRVDF